MAQKDSGEKIINKHSHMGDRTCHPPAVGQVGQGWVKTGDKQVQGRGVWVEDRDSVQRS